MDSVWEYSKGRGTRKSYGGEDTEYDMLSPAQRFALAAGIEKAKIIRSSNLGETIEFNLEDFKHLRGDEKDRTKVVDDYDEDEDNVA